MQRLSYGIDDGAHRILKRPGKPAPRRADVAPAAERLRDRRDVRRTGGTQAYLDAAVLRHFEQHADFDAVDVAGIIDESFQVFAGRAGLFQIRRLDLKPADPAVLAERQARQPALQDAQLRHRHPLQQSVGKPVAVAIAWLGYAWFQKTRRGVADVL